MPFLVALVRIAWICAVVVLLPFALFLDFVLAVRNSTLLKMLIVFWCGVCACLLVSWYLTGVTQSTALAHPIHKSLFLRFLEGLFGPEPVWFALYVVSTIRSWLGRWVYCLRALIEVLSFCELLLRGQ